MGYGDDYQKLSRYSRDTLSGKSLDWDKKPPLYKQYPPNLKRFDLDKPDRSGGEPLYHLLQQRRSVRNYNPDKISNNKLSQVLWASQGISLQTEYHQFRTTPSAGGLFPIETYCVINSVEGFPAGVYHYQVSYHNLVLLKEGNFGLDLARAALGQKMMRDASFNLVWTAMIDRSRWKYDQRAYRYIYLDAGHIAQNTALAAVSCELGSCQIGAFFDEEVEQIIGVDGEKEFVIYMTSVGRPL
ncbi:MAG: SagB/ThcOx family dehydrogenase [Bacillota bacterium]